jgi:OOP family OmpA-OmpF porin
MLRLGTVLVSVLLLAGCAQTPTYSERVVLLPNRDGRPSTVIVKSASGEQQLTAPYQAAEVAGNQQKVAPSSAAEVQQRYGDVLSLQPARPLTFMLFFNLGTTDLTPQSRAALEEVRQKIASFPAAQVSVIGHTDTSGTTEINDALSLKRALLVRDVLIQIGIPGRAIDVVGRGARELLVPTPAGVTEERNRRVEVKLR